MLWLVTLYTIADGQPQYRVGTAVVYYIVYCSGGFRPSCVSLYVACTLPAWHPHSHTVLGGGDFELQLYIS